MKSLKDKLEKRVSEGRLRKLRISSNLVDFCSNDYLGLARSQNLKEKIAQQIYDSNLPLGSTGSRLISGNSKQYEALEKYLADFHEAEAALLFNSGYDANLGLLSSIADRGDTILYDELSHASIRDGVRLSFAATYSFRHNSLEDLEAKLQRAKGNVFVAVESVYSMDGDRAPLVEIVKLAERYNANVIVDEAHASGVFGKAGQGLVHELDLQEKVFARMHTFGKALGAHGAVVLGSNTLRDYLINFARSLIYSTALPPHSLLGIEQAYHFMSQTPKLQQQLFENIALFSKLTANIPGVALRQSAIQVQIIPGNENVKARSESLIKAGFDVRPIYSPTVAEGQERLRICLHAFNSQQEISDLAEVLIQ